MQQFSEDMQELAMHQCARGAGVLFGYNESKQLCACI